MALEIRFNPDTREILAEDPEGVGALSRSFYGNQRKGVIFLTPEEALYLLDVRNGVCRTTRGEELTFNKLAMQLGLRRKPLARYHAFKDWRDRGLILRPIEELKGKYGRSPQRKYPGGKFHKPAVRTAAMFFPEDLMSVLDEEELGRKIYKENWFGQFGTYKAEQRGRLNKLDAYETLFLMRHCGLSLLNAKEKELVAEAKKRRPDFLLMYQVYEDWRLRGYVLKTGFKFGTHFRLYLPGASPMSEGEEWVHSKHVIHVFPRIARMLISEWARAIRVAHSVRKTFILAIPGQEPRKRPAIKLDFLLYHRKKDGIENPKEDAPHFLMWALGEEEYIGGSELADAIEQAKKAELDLILAIVDRETSVTHYRIRRIDLPGSDYEYYEITWEQP